MIFALMMFILPMTSLDLNPEVVTSENKSDVISVQVKFENGTIENFSFDSYDECEIEKLESLSNVVACTYQLADGSCSCTAATCAAASACFFGPNGCATPAPANNERRE